MHHLCLKGKFDASHFVVGVRSSEANMHGHTWKVEAVFESTYLDTLGDFPGVRELRKFLNMVLGELDHSCLNSILQGPEGKPADNPMNGNISRWLFSRLKAVSKGIGIRLVVVSVSDSEDTVVSFSG